MESVFMNCDPEHRVLLMAEIMLHPNRRVDQIDTRRGWPAFEILIQAI